MVEVHPGPPFKSGLLGVAPKISAHISLHQLCTHSQHRQISPRAASVSSLSSCMYRCTDRASSESSRDAGFPARSWVRSSPCSPTSSLSCDADCEARTSGRPRYKLARPYDFGVVAESQVCWKPRGSLDIGRLEPPPCAVTNREHPDRLSALIDFIYDPVHVRFLAIEQVPQFPS